MGTPKATVPDSTENPGSSFSFLPNINWEFDSFKQFHFDDFLGRKWFTVALFFCGIERHSKEEEKKTAHTFLCWLNWNKFVATTLLSNNLSSTICEKMVQGFHFIIYFTVEFVSCAWWFRHEGELLIYLESLPFCRWVYFLNISKFGEWNSIKMRIVLSICICLYALIYSPKRSRRDEKLVPEKFPRSNNSDTKNKKDELAQDTPLPADPKLENVARRKETDINKDRELGGKKDSYNPIEGSGSRSHFQVLCLI